MKKVAIISILIYQNTVSVLLKQLLGIKAMCRLTPSCSEYTKNAIEKYGLKKGIKMGFARLLHCQPFSHNYANI
jgi:putative component of membrane protein insertase Oxa1/YidC/SpoIIIJ protein YidD